MLRKLLGSGSAEAPMHGQERAPPRRTSHSAPSPRPPNPPPLPRQRGRLGPGAPHLGSFLGRGQWSAVGAEDCAWLALLALEQAAGQVGQVRAGQGSHTRRKPHLGHDTAPRTRSGVASRPPRVQGHNRGALAIGSRARPPPLEQPPAGPQRPHRAPHLGSREAWLAFGAQVTLWPGRSLQRDRALGWGIPSRTLDTHLRPWLDQGLCSGSSAARVPTRPSPASGGPLPQEAEEPLAGVLTGKPANPVRPWGERDSDGRSGLPRGDGVRPAPRPPGTHVPRGLARSPPLSVHASAEPRSRGRGKEPRLQ